MQSNDLEINSVYQSTNSIITKDKKRRRGKSARKKMCARGSCWEVIKNYAAPGGLWSAEKNGGREGTAVGNVTST